MNTKGAQSTCFWIDFARDDIAGEDVGGIWVWVAEKVSEGDGREGVVVGVSRFVEFNHCDGYGLC